MNETNASNVAAETLKLPLCVQEAEGLNPKVEVAAARGAVSPRCGRGSAAAQEQCPVVTSALYSTASLSLSLLPLSLFLYLSTCSTYRSEVTLH